jgi:aryl-alcohol dehydrogenase-like predicted oxidoreductase
MFRQRPADLFFKEAKKKNVGIIVRVPLASGLLSGKFNAQTEFQMGDHRHFNRQGEAFDKGETFSGIDFNTGLEAVEELKKIFPANISLAAVALKWILQFEEISTIIPGASKSSQVLNNLGVLQAEMIANEQLKQVQTVYEKYIKPSVHQLW